jgi:cobalt-zinc-cadmium efflux system outer membrane protein
MRHKPRRAVAAAMAIVSAFASTAFAQAPLSLDEALRMSLERQPALEAYTRTARASTEASIAARQLPDLHLSFGVQNLPVTGSEAFSSTADDMTMRTIGIGREQVRRSRRDAAASRILAEGEVTLAEQQLMVLRIQREVMLGWIAVLEAQQKQVILHALIERLEARMNAIEDHVSTGRATPADVVAVRAEIGAARADLAAASGDEGVGRAALARWIGDGADMRLTGGMPICQPPARQQSLARLGDHPMLDVARRQNVVADRAIDLARANSAPDWSWSVMYGQRVGNRSDMVGFGVSIDLPFNRSHLQDRRISEASELAAAARDRTEDTRHELLAGFDRALAQWTAAEARLNATTNETLPALRAAERALEARYAGGGGDLESILVARERTTRTSLEEAEQRATMARISADILYYVGGCAP